MTSHEGRGPSKGSEGRVLRALLDEHYTLVRSTEGRIFGAARAHPGRAWEHGLGDSPLMRSACLLFLAAHDKWPCTNAVAEASAYLRAKADGLTPSPVPMRCHWDLANATIYLDTCDAQDTVLCVDADGVRTGTPPMPFRRSARAAALRWDATPGGPKDLEPLWDLVRVTPSDRPVVLALLVSAWFTGTPQPVVLVTGPQDAGKTATARYLLSFVDPVTNERGRSLPGDEREWKAAVAASRVVLVDNLSHLSAAESDTLCRVATGGEASGRALYTDDSPHSTNLHVPVWLTAIGTGILRGDLASRMVRIELEPLDERSRLAESDLRERQETVRPQVLRGLLWLASAVLARWAEASRAELWHRMGDFALVARLVDELLGTAGEKRLADDAVDLAADVLDASPVAQAVRALFSQGATPLPEQMTATELLDRLNVTRRAHFRIEAATDKTWPRTPKMLSELLHRLEPALRQVHGIHIERRKSQGTRYLKITKTGPRFEVVA